MGSTARWSAIICAIVVVGVLADGRVAHAQEPFTLPTHDLTTWADQVRVTGSQLRSIVIARSIGDSQEIRPFSGRSVVGLGVNGQVEFTSGRGMIRIVAVDDGGREFLVYEAYALIAPAPTFQVRNGCRETCVLQAMTPSRLKIELVDASLLIETLVVNEIVGAPATQQSALEAAAQTERIKAAQEREIVAVLNQQLKAKGLKWVAGETSISRLSHAEKSRLLSCAATESNTPVNLQGAEYYVGGILEVGRRDEAAALAAPSSSLIPMFDWRARHGANRPSSPYYDGDPTGGGWITSIKSQRCGDCWAHSALGATEAVMNLYFNQHLDPDLSEQELVSCAGAGGCSGGSPTGALSYVQSSGVVDEACFPESGSDQPCGDCCEAPRERVAIAGFGYISPSDGEENIKRRLTDWGPLAFGIPSWWHALVLVGYDRDLATGETIWILKNSWGPGWGDHGFGYVKVPLADMYFVHDLYTPVISMVTPQTIACRDADGDGYFNWGLSAAPAPTCGTVPAIKDCDDSDPTLALLSEEGYCTALPDTTAPTITVRANPSILWPPNGQLVAVTISGMVVDELSGVDPNMVRFAVADEYGMHEPSGRIIPRSDGTYTVTVSLEAARSGRDKDGRLYTIIVSARDQAGNGGSSTSAVVVGHDARPSRSSTAAGKGRSGGNVR
jgi:hypothetical protein